MSEDKQLTVAELLARAGSENRDGAASRPRRRRSIDDGGVSVAELTGSLKKVEAQPAESKHSSVPLDAPAEPEKPAEKPEPEQTEPEQPTEEEQPTGEEQPAEEKQPELGEGDRQGVVKRAAVADDDTSVIGVVPGPEDTGVMPAVKEREEGSTAVAAEAPEADEENGSINPFMLVLLVLLGLAAGVGGFLGFQWIWANTQTVVAALIALVVVVAIVFGVRALRTGRDAVTMLLAGVAGAVMAFGPALIV
ncbi:hypothetical protein [Corynebacterium auris]|uniref:hypothetical protein n=1 Tax=Corynebacterium auris TaxID=44750 RepID=UPI0025B6046D|nr:hypothetical protein [Corynebacterium auris]WJY67219.1 hypothetical protein CAURIS_01440 [Corynebacterium auris]